MTACWHVELFLTLSARVLLAAMRRFQTKFEGVVLNKAAAY
jgi:hypothetical protein